MLIKAAVYIYFRKLSDDLLLQYVAQFEKNTPHHVSVTCCIPNYKPEVCQSIYFPYASH